MYQTASDWDGARASEWFYTGTHEQTWFIDYRGAGTSSMIGPMRRFGVGYWSHFHSGNPNDGHPDGYGFYSDSGPYDWYGGASWHHIDGCCHGWRDGDYLRMKMN